MDIISFLTRSADTSFYNQTIVIGFYGADEYPLLFFSHLLARIKTQGDLPIQSIDWDNQSDADVMRLITTSFLGDRMIYWCGNLEDLDSARKKKLMVTVADYQGPHILIYYAASLTDDLSKNDNEEQKRDGRYLSISLPTTVDKKLCLSLMNIYYPDMQIRNQSFVTALYSAIDAFPFDQVYVLMHYMCLAGKNQREFIDQWLHLLVVQEKSLFILSQHLFARQARKFFMAWSTIAVDYPAPFWITFWSEQIFRASMYVEYMQQRKMVDAKRIAFRLPFSFMQRDWRLYTVAQLRDAHSALYKADHAIKNGGNEYVLELFYARFFQQNGR